MIGRLLVAVLIAAFAVVLNVKIGNLWVDEGLAADAGLDVPPIQLPEFLVFALSGLVAVVVTALIVSFLAHTLTFRLSRKTTGDPWKTFLRAIRDGENPQLITGVLIGVISFYALMFLPGLFRG